MDQCDASLRKFSLSPSMATALVVHTAATFAAGFLVGRLTGRGRARGDDADAALAGKRGAQRGPSTLRTPGRTVAVVTTAALPWRTGAGARVGAQDRMHAGRRSFGRGGCCSWHLARRPHAEAGLAPHGRLARATEAAEWQRRLIADAQPPHSHCSRSALHCALRAGSSGLSAAHLCCRAPYCDPPQPTHSTTARALARPVPARGRHQRQPAAARGAPRDRAHPQGKGAAGAGPGRRMRSIYSPGRISQRPGYDAPAAVGKQLVPPDHRHQTAPTASTLGMNRPYPLQPPYLLRCRSSWSCPGSRRRTRSRYSRRAPCLRAARSTPSSYSRRRARARSCRATSRSCSTTVRESCGAARCDWMWPLHLRPSAAPRAIATAASCVLSCSTRCNGRAAAVHTATPLPASQPLPPPRRAA